MDVYFLFGFLLSIWTYCGFEFCYKTSVLTMSSQDKLRGKAQRKSAFVDISSRIVYHFCKMATGKFVAG